MRSILNSGLPIIIWRMNVVKFNVEFDDVRTIEYI